MDNFYTLFEVRERIFNPFQSKMFSIKIEAKGFPDKDHFNAKILTIKQMLQTLPIALAQVKAVNTSKNLINKIRQIIYFSYWAKQITKNVHNNSINSMSLWCKKYLHWRILKKVKHVTFTDYYSILQIK